MNEYKITECVGCGFCCMKAPCEAARRLYPGATICPQLLWSEDEKRYVCGLMRLGGDLGFYYRKELYEGAGCCMGLNTWRKDVKKRSPNEVTSSWIKLDNVFQVFLKCLANQFMSPDVLSLTLSAMQHEMKETLGFKEEDCKKYINVIVHYLKEQRTNQYDSFFGEFKP